MKPNFAEGEAFHHMVTVGEGVYQGFIDVFQDRNPLHVDDDFARRHGFRERVMHGNILNGFLSHFVGECLPHKEVIIHRQDIRYSAPVYRDDVLDFRAQVTHVSASTGTVEFKFWFTNAGARKVASGTLQIGLLPHD